MTKYFIKTTPPMKDWVECTKDEYMKMERFCGFFSKFDNEPATGSFGKWKDDIEIQGKTEENRPRA
jgi:hypothetical protein